MLHKFFKILGVVLILSVVLYWTWAIYSLLNHIELPHNEVIPSLNTENLHPKDSYDIQINRTSIYLSISLIIIGLLAIFFKKLTTRN